MNDAVYPGKPGEQPIECAQGATVVLTLTFCHPVPGSDPLAPDLTNPINMSGKDFEAFVKLAPSRTQKSLLTLPVDATNAATGVIKLTIPLAANDTLDAGDYYYDFSGWPTGYKEQRQYYAVGPFKVNATTNSKLS